MKRQDEMQKQELFREQKKEAPMPMELKDEELEQITGGYIIPNFQKEKKKTT